MSVMTPDQRASGPQQTHTVPTGSRPTGEDPHPARALDQTSGKPADGVLTRPDRPPGQGLPARRDQRPEGARVKTPVPASSETRRPPEERADHKAAARTQPDPQEHVLLTREDPDPAGEKAHGERPAEPREEAPQEAASRTHTREEVLLDTRGEVQERGEAEPEIVRRGYEPAAERQGEQQEARGRRDERGVRVQEEEQAPPRDQGDAGFRGGTGDPPRTGGEGPRTPEDPDDDGHQPERHRRNVSEPTVQPGVTESNKQTNPKIAKMYDMFPDLREDLKQIENYMRMSPNERAEVEEPAGFNNEELNRNRSTLEGKTALEFFTSHVGEQIITEKIQETVEGRLKPIDGTFVSQIEEYLRPAVESALPGSKLPSLRKLRSLFGGVSMDTVLGPVTTLIAEGLLEARPGSGYFVIERTVEPREPQPQSGVRSQVELGAAQVKDPAVVIANTLRERIAQGRTGELLGTQAGFEDEFGTTKRTIRRAIGILASEGSVKRTTKGVFIADAENPVNQLPLYVQIAIRIQEDIVSGELQLGQAIPTKKALAERFETTPQTVLKAIKALRREGILALVENHNIVARRLTEIEIKRTNLYQYQRAAEALRPMLVGKQKGEQLPTLLALAGEVGMAAETVREGLRILESQGLVVVVPKKGILATGRDPYSQPEDFSRIKPGSDVVIPPIQGGSGEGEDPGGTLETEARVAGVEIQQNKSFAELLSERLAQDELKWDDRTPGNTLTEQVESALRDVIGQLPPGTLIPREKDLRNMFRAPNGKIIARNTLRNAIKPLSRERLLELRQGSGTFVGDPENSAEPKPENLKTKIGQTMHLIRVDLQDLEYGDMLEGERDLARRYRVSIDTIREAIERLELAGDIYSWHDRGSYKKDPDAPAPEHPVVQVVNGVNEIIAQGKIGDQLPTEDQLMDMFGTSKTDIREAMGQFAAAKIVLIRPGKGTFIANPQTLTAEQQLPLYQQVRIALGTEIDSGALQPGERLKTEVELMAQFGVGRNAVRRALYELSLDGKVTRRSGGNIVALPRAPGEEPKPVSILYQEVADNLRGQFVSMKPGDRLKTLPQLAEEMGVSEITIKGALRLLKEDQLIHTSRSGTVYTGGIPLPIAERMPLFEKVAFVVRERIDHGIYRQGQPIPTENALAAELGVSVWAVARAMVELKKEGIID